MSERVESNGTRLPHGVGNFDETTTITTIINDNASNNCDDSSSSNILIIIVIINNNNDDDNSDPYSFNFYFLKSTCIIKKNYSILFFDI